MKAVVLDSYIVNPGDLKWCDLSVSDRTAP